MDTKVTPIGIILTRGMTIKSYWELNLFNILSFATSRRDEIGIGINVDIEIKRPIIHIGLSAWKGVLWIQLFPEVDAYTDTETIFSWVKR